MHLCGPLIGPILVDRANISWGTFDQVVGGHRSVGEPLVTKLEEIRDDKLTKKHLKPARFDAKRIGEFLGGHRTLCELSKDLQPQSRAHRHRRNRGAGETIYRLARWRCGWFCWQAILP